MSKLLFSLVVLSWSVTVNAEIMIYGVKMTNNLTGNGTTIKQVINGRFVADPDGVQSPKYIVWGKRDGQNVFAINCPELTATYVMAPRRVEHTVFQMTVPNPIDVTFMYARGTNNTLSISQARTVRAPKVLRGIIRETVDEDGTKYFNEGTLILTYQSGATVGANGAGQTIMDAINALAATLIGSGYTQIFDDDFCSQSP